MSHPPRETEFSQLTERIRALLPEWWRAGFVLERDATALVLRVQEREAGLHTLVVQRLSDATECLMVGQRLAFGLRGTPTSKSDSLARYVALFEQLKGMEDAIERALPAPRGVSLPLAPDAPNAPAQVEGSTLCLRERELRRHHANSTLSTLLGRLPSGASGHVDLFLENGCDQGCEFCEQAQLPRVLGLTLDLLRHVETVRGGDFVSQGALDALLDGLAQHDPPLSLMVTGNDWTRHPMRDRLLERLEREQRVHVAFHGPNTALSDPRLVERLRRLPTLAVVQLTLLSADPAVHDAVTNTPGSGARVLTAIRLLREAQIRVKLFTVLTRTVVEHLPSLLAYLASQGLKTNLLGFWPDRHFFGWNGEALMSPVQELRRLLEADLDRARRTIDAISSVPRCALPEELREKLIAGQRDSESEKRVFAPGCSSCVERPRCSGVPETYAKTHGFGGLTLAGATPREAVGS